MVGETENTEKEETQRELAQVHPSEDGGGV